ncbi:MAG: 2-oxoacid ferredoxin oxidoreductase [Candidatus Latescibacteria bacterium]|nr:2-oxoacid ferredoxin oxidoreductase [bacterium]MBD3424929.1 2-oxoacid ferredoxin oxidoreductase [Candidatus Latescibacterota bacterium]
MSDEKFNMEGIDIAWCPGCGNFGILKVLKKTVQKMGIEPEELVLVSGIGQAAKIPHYFRCNFFNGLHGRALPPATAIKAANRSLTVIAESGDGDMYGEGGNHFIHAIRRNPDITNIVHNNMIYGLTKGQASPTSRIGMKTPVQTAGVILEPFNPLTVAIALDAGLVARAYIGDAEKTEEILREAISFDGYALVDLFQPCVTFNKLNTYNWFKENTYYLDDSHDSGDRVAAFEKATETDKLPLGIFYRNTGKKPFEENTGIYQDDHTPLFQREVDYDKLESLIGQYTLK